MATLSIFGSAHQMKLHSSQLIDVIMIHHGGHKGYVNTHLGDMVTVVNFHSGDSLNASYMGIGISNIIEHNRSN